MLIKTNHRKTESEANPMSTMKTILTIDGMMCGMCEAHVCDVVRKTVPDAKKVAASRKKGEASFLTESAADEEKLRARRLCLYKHDDRAV